MLPISSSFRLIIWIITGIASFVFALLVVVLDKNIRHFIQKKGRPPGAKSPLVWFFFWLAAITIVLGTAIASSAPEAITSSGNQINVDPTTTPLSNYLLIKDLKRKCVNLKYWQPFAYLYTADIFSSSIKPEPILPKQTDGCLQNDSEFNWGFEASDGSIIIRNKSRDGQITTFYAISILLEKASIIKFDVTLNKLEGDLVVGIQPDPTSLLMDWDLSKAYLDISPDENLVLRRGFVTNIGKQSFAKGVSHHIVIEVSSNHLLVNVDNQEGPISIDGKFGSPYLVIGYIVNGGNTVDVTFNNLELNNN